jgi:hypothetical protein
MSTKEEIIIVRHYREDFPALMAAQAMEQEGGTVIAVSDAGIGDEFRFRVWCRVKKGSVTALDLKLEEVLRER